MAQNIAFRCHCILGHAQQSMWGMGNGVIIMTYNLEYEPREADPRCMLIGLRETEWQPEVYVIQSGMGFFGPSGFSIRLGKLEAQRFPTVHAAFAALLALYPKADITVFSGVRESITLRPSVTDETLYSEWVNALTS